MAGAGIEEGSAAAVGKSRWAVCCRHEYKHKRKNKEDSHIGKSKHRHGGCRGRQERCCECKQRARQLCEQGMEWAIGGHQ